MSDAASAVLFGGLAAYCLILGTLAMERPGGDQKKARTEGVKICWGAVPMTGLALFALFKTLVRGCPSVRACREGVVLRTFAMRPLLAGLPSLRGPKNHARWAAAGQGFLVQTVRIPWPDLSDVTVTGLMTGRRLAVRGKPETSGQVFDLWSPSVEFTEPTEAVAEALRRFARDGAARAGLPGWDEFD